MEFDLRVVRNNPLTGETDLDEALRTFLKQIGYLPEAYDDDFGLRLISSCFLAYPKKPWTIDELLTYLETNKSTLYRYLNKLKGLDLIEEEEIPPDTGSDPGARKTRKGYKIRFSSLSLAWSLVESHTNVAMDNYRRSVDHIDRLAVKRSKGEAEAPRKAPSLTVDAIISRGAGKGAEVLLIKRKNEPYKGMWALPGGFVDYGERTSDAVLREVKEETGLSCIVRELSHVASDPARDPRGHTVSIVYSLDIEGESTLKAGDDASEAEWFPVSNLPGLAFDHEKIIRSAL
ncbi:MAG: NUDIX domain-containing protein [Thermoplasmatota archaeon]